MGFRVRLELELKLELEVKPELKVEPLKLGRIIGLGLGQS